LFCLFVLLLFFIFLLGGILILLHLLSGLRSARSAFNHTGHVDDAEQQGNCCPQSGVSMLYRRVGIIYVLPGGQFGSCPLITCAATPVGCNSSTCGMDKYRALPETEPPGGNTKNFQ
jgi:hypothetical protein